MPAAPRQTAVWATRGKKCRCNQDGFDIPKGGYARIYYDTVMVYNHDNHEVDRKKVTYCEYAGSQGGK